MADPLTWSVVGVSLVTEGIKFLYGQATEALKRLNEKKKDSATPASVPTAAPVPDIFKDTIDAPTIHLDAVQKLEVELKQVRANLAEYADDLAVPSEDDPKVLQELDGLRRLMEAIYRQPLTFKGEVRDLTRGHVESELYINEVAGYVTGVVLKRDTNADIYSQIHIEKTLPGSTTEGVRIE